MSENNGQGLTSKWQRKTKAIIDQSSSIISMLGGKIFLGPL